MENNRIVWGCINDNGTTYSGIGFTGKLEKTGFYKITYNERFPFPPAVVLTQNYPNWNETTPPSSGNTLDNCVLVASDDFGFLAKTGDRSGDPSNRNFTFIAVGLSMPTE